MTALELLQQLESLGIDLRADEGRLQVNAPRGRLTDDLREAVASNKAVLLELLQARRSRLPAELVPLPRSSPLPLSFFQERLWVLNRLEPGSTVYNLATLWPRPGPVEIERYTTAISAVVRRHEILHTTFQDREQGPVVQLVQPEAVPIAVQDLHGLPEEEPRRRVYAARDQAVSLPFDLSSEPPARFTVFQLGDRGVITMASLHHIAVDAWSIGLLLAEIDAIYDGTVPEAPRLQYADFAAWQRRTHDLETIRPELDWWTERLAGIPPLSTFPAEQPAALDKVVAPSHVHDLRLSQELSDRIRSLAREARATVYMAFVAACAVVLSRHTGQTDLVIGSPMGVREQPELEKVIGPFVNLVLIRIDLSGSPSFLEVLVRARESALEAHAHRQLPFEHLIERLKPARSLQHSPLFQVAVVQHNAPAKAAVDIAGGGALHELTLFVRDVGGCFETSLEYRPDLYSEAAIRRIAVHLKTVLSAAVRDANAPVRDLTMLGPDERRLVVEQFNDTAVDADPAVFVVRFERQAARTPDAVAVAFEGGQLTYGELNRRANELAWRLRAHGVGRDSTVALCLERNASLVVALVGIQKTGAAYLPLDPGFPPERIAFMLEDSGSTVLVASDDVARDLKLPFAMMLVDPQAHDAPVDASCTDNPQLIVDPQDAAYMIYTSGSTGKPKGVVVSHGALANFLWSMQREPGLSSSDVLAAVTTISFDISGLEIYLPLVVGARIELVARHVSSDGPALAQQLEECGATVLQATPATWRLLLESGWMGGPRFKALCGGESLPRELADLLLDRVGELWNLYGPTETTIWSTVARIERGQDPITVGRPIANTQVYVLDAAGSPSPIGVAGEIWIGGAGLANGYHRRPDLTAERFVPDRLARAVGARLYRTGDLGRWDGAGRLHHLGRLDHQVKIRGFRIELGEIEAVLGTHPAVRQAICATHEAGPGDLRLVGYVDFMPGQDLTVSEVRRYLRRHLPDYMVPSVIVRLDTVPLTPNGKVDRSALPDPFRAASGSRDFEAPAEGLEQALAEIWREILQIERVSAWDNFFELGGHSLLSLRVAAAFKKATGRRMDPRSLFFQSLRQAAATVAREPAGKYSLGKP